jgi:thiamine-monophosphate kinase
VEYLDAFMDGFHELSDKFKVPLMGGDTTKSPGLLVINVGVIGKCTRGRARLRSMAAVGDRLCVTGYLGDSAAGLNVLLQDLDLDEDKEYLVQKHHLPEPRVPEGMWLSKRKGVHAIIDISDGISSDLTHVINASAKSAVVDTGYLPISDQLRKVAADNGWDVTGLAISGGEDYELLCTIEPARYDAISNDFSSLFNRPLHPIGEITGGDTGIRWTREGKDIDLERTGYNHFTTE